MQIMQGSWWLDEVVVAEFANSHCNHFSLGSVKITCVLVTTYFSVLVYYLLKVLTGL